MSLSFNRDIALRLVRELWPVGCTLAGLLIAAFAGLALGATPADAVRFAGTALQVMGLITVAAGLAELRRVFDRPSVKQVVAGWLQLAKAVLTKRRRVLGAMSGTIRLKGSATGTLTKSLAPGAPLHKRITLLEEQVRDLREALNRSESSLRQEITEARAAADQGLRQRADEIQQTAVRLEQVSVGGIHLEAMASCGSS